MALGPRPWIFLTATAIGLVFPLSAQAQQETPKDNRGSLAQAAERPTGMAELGFGWLTLPGAEVCVQRTTEKCARGDSSLALEVWQLFRMARVWAFGAGLTLGLTPAAAPRRPGAVPRDHTRRYLAIEGAARYYPYIGDQIELWVGLTTGVAVVSDQFATRANPPDDRALIGPQGVTIRTEGLTLGAAVGIAYEFFPSWLLGGNIRYGSWFLPRRPAKDPLGDEASLVGQNSVFVIAVNIAYRARL